MSEFEKKYEELESDCQEAFSKLSTDKMRLEEKIMVLNTITMLDMTLHWISERITEDEKKATKFWEMPQTFIDQNYRDGLSSKSIYFDDVEMPVK